MNIVFCADRNVLPGLHVSAYSLLHAVSKNVGKTQFYVFSNDLSTSDIMLLHKTLSSVMKSFSLELRRLDSIALSDFPTLNGSLATYFRLIVPQLLNVDRFLYMDVDTLCDVDVSGLSNLALGEAAAGMVPESCICRAADRFVGMQLGNSSFESYFNAGVILVNVPEWRSQRITERALEYIVAHRPPFHDQSALNFVLYRKAVALEARFNCIANMRINWPALRKPYGQISRCVHFLDYPKPWDFLGEFVHPQAKLWQSVLNETALRGFRSWQRTAERKLPTSKKTLKGYKRALKDRILFSGYRSGWLSNVKGVPPATSLHGLD